MNDVSDEASESGLSQRSVEIGVAITISILAMIGMIGTLRVGTG